jgi:chromatin assembly factor 1 subunit B
MLLCIASPLCPPTHIYFISLQPSVVVRANPLLFELPEVEAVSCKENSNPASGSLPYRSIFAVLTLDSVLIYDTHHLEPLSVISGLHYAGLTDCCWSRDGRNLIVSSSDGYMSIINFAPGELGKVLVQQQQQPTVTEASPSPPEEQERLTSPKVAPLQVTIPPCEPGQSGVLEGPPAKRAKKTRIAPTLIASPPSSENKRQQETTTMTMSSLSKETERVGDAVTRLSLDGEKPPKKKKRVQPFLVSN